MDADCILHACGCGGQRKATRRFALLKFAFALYRNELLWQYCGFEASFHLCRTARYFFFREDKIGHLWYFGEEMVCTKQELGAQ